MAWLSSPNRTASPEALRERAHRLIPAGAHTYSKGDDQFPANAPAFIVRGEGARVWDTEDREFLDWGMGLRAVVLGHAYPRVVEAAREALGWGCNFVRPAPIEANLAEAMLALLPGQDMIKFAKNGSDVTTAAVRLARAFTGRKLVAIASDNPFYSVDDWFIGTTVVNAGIPEEVARLTVSFRYGDLAGLERLFAEHCDEIACVAIEPALTAPSPPAGGCRRCSWHRREGAGREAECPNTRFLAAVRDLAHRHGALLIFDEMLTGFRWDVPGAQRLYGVVPDLTCFGKALGNGFSVSALSGTREVMELGGIRQTERPRVFLLSATHGGETHSLAAALAVVREMCEQPVVPHLWEIGGALQRVLNAASERAGLVDHVWCDGYPCGPVLNFAGAEGSPGRLRTLFHQEMVARGILMPYIAPSYSHTLEDVARTAEAANATLEICRRALEEGFEPFLGGSEIKPVFRRFS